MDDDAVIPLSRWRAALARARKGRRADVLLADDDAAKLVPKLPVQDLYYAISEVGLADAQELMALATPKQIRGIVDLDIWERDQLDANKLDPWLESLVTVGPEKLAAVFEELDGEVVALWLQRHARVYDLTMDEVPEDSEGTFYPTPDRFFLLDIFADGEPQKAFARVIDWLYRADLDLARRVMMSARWELTADLEEYSYRWRSGRLADLGYAEYYDALSVYRWLDPASVQLDEGAPPPVSAAIMLPMSLAAAVDDKGAFGRALGTFTDEKSIDELQGHLMVLVNRVMAADRVAASDMDGARTALERAVGYLDLGVEFVSKGDLVRAGRALETIELERLFRLGLSLTLQLARLAHTLWEKGRLRAPHLLLDPPFDALVTALRQTRPLFALDGNARPFRSLLEISRAAFALEEIAAAPLVAYAALGLTPADAEAAISHSAAPDEARFGTLVRTAAGHLLIDQPATLAPLGAAEVALVARATPEARDAVWARLKSAAAGVKHAEAWFARWRPLLDTPAQPAALLVRLMG